MRALLILAVLTASLVPVQAAAVPIVDKAMGIVDEATSTVPDPLAPDEEPPAEQPAPPAQNPGFAESVRSALGERMSMASLAGALATVVGLAGFMLVTRYVSPKEALKNPQRAMLYGYVRATPGCHLKQLSDEFGMKSSSILWHVRKLESADLVRSERANGYRVFYPVEGGVELRRVSRALTALQNQNGRRVFGHIESHPGASAPQISRSTGIHPGTVRWHLRKLRDFGLLEELVSDHASRFYTTPLGRRSLETLEGQPTQTPQGMTSPVPLPERA